MVTTMFNYLIAWVVVNVENRDKIGHGFHNSLLMTWEFMAVGGFGSHFRPT